MSDSDDESSEKEMSNKSKEKSDPASRSPVSSYSDDVSFLVDQVVRNVESYNETDENKAMRETMEKLVSKVVTLSDNPTPEDDIIVLAPDHPMLARFHASVQRHLEKQKNQILNDIKELNTKLKSNQKEADDKAEKLYILQQTLSRQQAQLDLRAENLVNDSEAREELELRVQEYREKHKSCTTSVQHAQTKEELLWRKLNEQNEKEHGAQKKKENEDSKLAVVRRASEKAQIDKKILAEEKKKQDELVYRLTCEVADLESRLGQLESQLDAKQEERSRLVHATTAAAEELTAQAEERHRLEQAWQRLLVSAQARESRYSKLLTEKTTVEEEKRTTETETEGYKKEGTKEMERNEQLTLCVQRLIRDRKIAQVQIAQDKITIENEQIQLSKINTMLKLTEEDLVNAEKVLQEKEEKTRGLDKDIANLTTRQMNLEEKILEAMNEQASKDKAVHHAIKGVEKLTKEIEALESVLAQKTAAVATVRLEAQRQRFAAACTAQLVAQRETEVARAREALNAMEHELKRAQLELATSQSALDRCNRNIHSLIDKTGGKEENPMKSRIRNLEENIKDLTKEIEQLQKQILRREVHQLEQTKNQENTRKEIDDCNISVAHLRHKIQTQRASLEQIEAREVVLMRRTEEELHLLTTVDQEHARLRDLREALEQHNSLAFKDVLAARKAEVEELEQLGSTLASLELERQSLHDTLSELQRQQVDLEADVTLATETKQAIDKERSRTGEIAALTSEIHRMEVRLGQLKRTQERLTQDLDQCVLRRDAMVDSARARSTRPLAGPSTTQMKTMRKLETLRHANKQLLAKIQECRGDNTTFKKLEDEIKELQDELSNKQKEMAGIKEPLSSCEAKLEKLSRKKKQNLEQLVHEQKRGRGLQEAKEGRYKPACRSEAVLTTEGQRQRVTLTNLLSVVESLRPDFPPLASQLAAIAALLKSIKVVYAAAEQPPPDTTSQHETTIQHE